MAKKHTKSKPESKANLNQQSTIRTAHVCISLYTTEVHSTAQNGSENLPLILQTIIIDQMLCTERGGGVS